MWYPTGGGGFGGMGGYGGGYGGGYRPPSAGGKGQPQPQPSMGGKGQAQPQNTMGSKGQNLANPSGTADPTAPAPSGTEAPAASDAPSMGGVGQKLQDFQAGIDKSGQSAAPPATGGKGQPRPTAPQWNPGLSQSLGGWMGGGGPQDPGASYQMFGSGSGMAPPAQGGKGQLAQGDMQARRDAYGQMVTQGANMLGLNQGAPTRTAGMDRLKQQAMQYQQNRPDALTASQGQAYTPTGTELANFRSMASQAQMNPAAVTGGVKTISPQQNPILTYQTPGALGTPVSSVDAQQPNLDKPTLSQEQHVYRPVGGRGGIT